MKYMCGQLKKSNMGGKTTYKDQMEKTPPVVGILLPTYNGEKYLEQQLDSIFSQTYSNFILYIADDKSIDETLKIIETFQQTHKKQIQLVVNQERLGVVKNFERLIERCTEPYIALCDQDDVWEADKLALQIRKLQEIERVNIPGLVNSDLCIVNADLEVIHASFLRYRKINLPNEKCVNKIISHNGVMGCTILMNRALAIKALPFPDNLDVHDYWLALVNEIFGIRYTIEEPLVKYRIHETNTSNNAQKIFRKRGGVLPSIINSDPLPFVGLKREKVLSELMRRYPVEAKDLVLLKAFQGYLVGNGNPVKIMWKLVALDLIRQGFLYRIKIFIKLLQRAL